MARNGWWCSAGDRDGRRADSECAYEMGAGRQRRRCAYEMDGQQRRRCDREAAGRRRVMARRSRRAEVLSRDCTGRKDNVLGVARAEGSAMQYSSSE